MIETMNPKNYLINNRHFTDPLNSHRIEGKNYLFDLSYLSALAATGERASEFLQGQLSCDLRQVTPISMQRGLMCNLKGRILTLLDVIDWQGLQLILPKDLLSVTENSLAKTALLSRVKLEAISNQKIYGFYLANPNDLLPSLVQLPGEPLGFNQSKDACCYSIGNNCYVIITHEDQAASLISPFDQASQFLGSASWHEMQLRSKQVLIYPETRGLFLPHRLDLHLAGYISFDKGCYKGQEIIARTHYRATLKHGLRIFNIITKEKIEIGTKLFSEAKGIELGELIDFIPIGLDCYLIAASILLEHPDEVLIEGHSNKVVLGIHNSER